MSRTIQARLDAETESEMRKLRKALDCSDSQIIREALKFFAAYKGPRKRRHIYGTGRFSSDITDLASNKKHLRGFGV